MNLPEKYTESMKMMLGDEYDSYIESFNDKRLYGLRVNNLKISTEDFLKICPFKLEPVPWIENGFYYSEDDKPAKHPYYFAGLYYIQEPSAMTPANVLPIEEGDVVFDMCAAPGGKSTELAAKLNKTGLIITNDISNSRAKALLKNVEVFGVPNLCVLNEDPVGIASRISGFFDKVLIDSPCSGEGMFRKDNKLIKAWEKNGPEFYSQIQRNIILAGADMLKPGGKLLYSTCTFSKLEDYRATFTNEENDDIFERVTQKVCRECENREKCLGERRQQTYHMMREILCAVQDYGAELNVELKRRLMKQCLLAPRFLRETLENYENVRQKLIWNNKMVQNREGFAAQLNDLAKTLCYTTHELDAGIFEDEHLKKKIRNQLKKSGIKILSSVFYMTAQGKYEIHLTLKASKGHIVAMKELASEVGKMAGRIMVPGRGERPIIGDEYCTVACVEGARFHTIQGVAKIGKGSEKISGDTFLTSDLPGGRKGVALSDGMGSGERAFRESTMVVEMLEELLNAGFPVKTAVQIMNTALVTGREEVMFSTIDVAIIDLYDASCEIVKAGAATTYIKRKDEVEEVHSISLPIGALARIDIEPERRQLEDGDFLVMVTDGVLDTLPTGKQDSLMEEFICQVESQNPGEMAHHILNRVMEYAGAAPLDDMTILVTGIWKL